MIRIGIDEAGLGPKVGPLVISATLFRFHESPAQSLWQGLAGVVCRADRRRTGRLVVDDSKRVYSRQRGLGLLEEGVLSFLSASGLQARALAELVDAVSVGPRRRADRYPWYQDMGLGLPRTPAGLGASVKARRLSAALDGQGVELVAMRSLIAHPYEYNGVVSRIGSKLVALFGLVARLIQRVLPACAGEEVSIVADNLGGQRAYAPLIGRFFRGAGIRIEQQSAAGSHYGVRWRDQEFRLAFLIGGDGSCFEAALASMQSKYLRELHMELFNAYWQAQVPGLRPTAGYGRDGGRFVREVEPKLAELGLDRLAVVRQR